MICVKYLGSLEYVGDDEMSPRRFTIAPEARRLETIKRLRHLFLLYYRIPANSLLMKKVSTKRYKITHFLPRLTSLKNKLLTKLPHHNYAK